MQIRRNWLAAATLGVGVAACTAIFSFIHPLLLNPFAYPKASELVMVEARDGRGNPAAASLENFRAWVGESGAFRGMAAFDIGFFFLSNASEPEQIAGALVTPNLFRVLGVGPALGRDFAEREDRVVILTDAAWRRHFNADPNILGRSIALDFARTTEVERYTVIGVLPPNFWMYYAGFEAFVPLDEKSAGNLYVIGRRAAGVTVEQAQSTLRALPIEKDKTVLARSWEQEASRPVRSALLAMAAASILLLLIAAVNVTGLLIARASARRREIAIRSALGATPWRLVQLMIGESVQIAAVAAVVGISLARALVTILVSKIPPDLASARLLSGLGRVTLDWKALVFGVGVAMVACVVAQILPAFDLRKIDLVTGLKDARVAGRPRARKVLVTVEVALSVVLLSSAGMLLKTMRQIQEIDLGFRPQNILVLRLPVRREQMDRERTAAYYDAVAARLSELPGVQSVALTSQQPLTGERPREFTIAGGEKISANDRVVGANYFATLGIGLRRGRFFDALDRHRVVINEAMARRYWPNEGPIGRAILLGEERLEVAGVAADTRSRLFEKEGPTVYRSNRDAPAGQMAIRTAGNPLALARAVRSAVAEMGGTVAEISTMEHFVRNDSWQHEQTAALTTLFAGLAFLLATVGLYGVVSFGVTRRRKEIGIRVALGARRRDVIGLVLRESAGPIGIGLGVGMAVGLGVNQSLPSLFYEVGVGDWTVIAGVVVAVGIAAVVASYVPVRRALAVDPAGVLRDE